MSTPAEVKEKGIQNLLTNRYTIIKCLSNLVVMLILMYNFCKSHSGMLETTGNGCQGLEKLIEILKKFTIREDNLGGIPQKEMAPTI